MAGKLYLGNNCKRPPVKEDGSTDWSSTPVCPASGTDQLCGAGGLVFLFVFGCRVFSLFSLF